MFNRKETARLPIFQTSCFELPDYFPDEKKPISIISKSA